MELYLLNLETEELEKLQEVYEEQPGVDCKKDIIQIAEQYKESLIEGEKLFIANGKSARYRVTRAFQSDSEDDLYFDVADSDERIEFYEAYKRAFILPAPVPIGFGSYFYSDVDGERYFISKTMEQLCAFIMKYRFKNVKIVDILDHLQFETSIGPLMYCADQKFLLDELLPIIIPMQKGKVEVPEFVPFNINNYRDELIRKNERILSIPMPDISKLTDKQLEMRAALMEIEFNDIDNEDL